MKYHLASLCYNTWPCWTSRAALLTGCYPQAIRRDLLPELERGEHGMLGISRAAFKLKLKPGMAAEYQKRHDAIWPELSDAIRKAGISDYSIFLDEEPQHSFPSRRWHRTTPREN